MVYLEQNKFLLELAKLYGLHTEKGSVQLTMKQVYPSEINKSLPKDQKLLVVENQDPHVFIRAVADKKKISTSISATDQLQFQSLFSSIVKTNVTGLKAKPKNRLLKPSK